MGFSFEFQIPTWRAQHSNRPLYLKKACRDLWKNLLNFMEIGIERSRHFSRQGALKTDRELPLAVAWAIAPWKAAMLSPFFPEYRVVVANGKGGWRQKKKILDRQVDLIFLAWGYQESPEVASYAADRNIPLYRLEDGFIRSSALGAQHTMPYSLVLDKTGIYFDATRPSDLENLLNSYPFERQPELMRAARQLLAVMRELHVSKYNLGTYGLPCHVASKSSRRRVLVIGQVPKDASLSYGWAKDWSDEKLLEKARDENPDAEILYRPHPESLYLSRKNGLPHLRLIEEPWCSVVPEDLILAELFQIVDHVYTMTSLSGMEALIHGLPVTTTGMPFYAGWGLTDDLQTCTRRTRKLSLEELFCAAYLLYPRYYSHPEEPILGCLETMTRVVSSRFCGLVHS